MLKVLIQIVGMPEHISVAFRYLLETVFQLVFFMYRVSLTLIPIAVAVYEFITKLHGVWSYSFLVGQEICLHKTQLCYGLSGF